MFIDLICFTRESAQLVEALEGRCNTSSHVALFGFMALLSWFQPRKPAQSPDWEYGEGKAQIEEYLLEKRGRDGFPATHYPPRSHCGSRLEP